MDSIEVQKSDLRPDKVGTQDDKRRPRHFILGAFSSFIKMRYKQMRKLPKIWLFIILAAQGAPARQPAKLSQGATVEKAITAREVQRFHAMTENDLAALTPILADDLSYTHANGWTQTKTEFLDTLRQGKLRYLSIEPASIQVHSYGTAAVVTGRAAFKVRSEGKEEGFQLRFIDVYVKRHGRWQMVAWQSTRLPEKSP
jgi:hypothetical protein